MPAGLAGSTATLGDFGDRRGHRHHGLFGGLLIEPKGSTWHDPQTGAPITTGAAAVIRWTDASGKPQVYREHAIDWEDGLNLRTATGAAVPAANEVDDPYDLGNRGVNYRTERFAPRLAKDRRSEQRVQLDRARRPGHPGDPRLRRRPGQAPAAVQQRPRTGAHVRAERARLELPAAPTRASRS